MRSTYRPTGSLNEAFNFFFVAAKVSSQKVSISCDNPDWSTFAEAFCETIACGGACDVGDCGWAGGSIRAKSTVAAESVRLELTKAALAGDGAVIKKGKNIHSLQWHQCKHVIS